MGWADVQPERPDVAAKRVDMPGGGVAVRNRPFRRTPGRADRQDGHQQARAAKAPAGRLPHCSLPPCGHVTEYAPGGAPSPARRGIGGQRTAPIKRDARSAGARSSLWSASRTSSAGRDPRVAGLAQLAVGAVRWPPNTPATVRTARSTPIRPTMIALVATALTQPGVPPRRMTLGQSSTAAPDSTATAANTSAHQPWVCQPFAYMFSCCWPVRPELGAWTSSLY